MKKKPAISVVVPAHNEEDNIAELLRQTMEALKKITENFEIIVIDDGSNDNTFHIANEKACGDKRITVVRHQHKKGKSLSLCSGFKLAKGDIVVMMDADLQYSPHEIQCLLEPFKKGYDVVNGYRDYGRYKRSRTLLSKIYNHLTSHLLGRSKVHDLNCGFKAFRKEVIKRLIREFTWREGIHRYLINLCAFLGYKIAEVNVSLRTRKRGQSKYGLKRLWNGFLLLLLLFLQVRVLGTQKADG